MKSKTFTFIITASLLLQGIPTLANSINQDVVDQASDHLETSLLASCRNMYRDLELEKKELDAQILDAKLSLERNQEATTLLEKEVAIIEERLSVCLQSSKSHESREEICKQELELSKSKIKAAISRQEEAEKALRKNDCSTLKNDLQLYRNRAEEAEIDRESLRRKLMSADDRCKGLPSLQSKLETVEKDALECIQDREVILAELRVTKGTLDVLIEALAAKEEYNRLKHAHEHELLPYWMKSLASSVHSTLSFLYQNTISMSAPTIKSALDRWDAMLDILPGWKYIKHQGRAVSKSRVVVVTMISLKKGLHICTKHALNAEEYIEDALLKQLRRIEVLKHSPLVTKEIIHYIVWLSMFSMMIPVLVKGVVFLLLKRKIGRGVDNNNNNSASSSSSSTNS